MGEIRQRPRCHYRSKAWRTIKAGPTPVNPEKAAFSVGQLFENAAKAAVFPEVHKAVCRPRRS
jgi:hypothetical protein